MKKIFIIALLLYCQLTFSQVSLESFIFSGADYGTSTTNSIAIDPNKNVIYTGGYQGTLWMEVFPGVNVPVPSDGGEDIFIIKMDSLDNVQWSSRIGGQFMDGNSSIVVDSAGNIYLTGSFQNLADFDPQNAIQSMTSAGGTDIFAIKITPNGALVWAKRIGGTGNDAGYSMAIDENRNIYITGYFSGTVDFDPGIGTYNMVASAANNLFVTKLDSMGNLVWAKKMDVQSGRDIVLDNDNNILLCGSFRHSAADFDPGPSNYILSSPISFDSFISKLDNDGNFMWAKQMKGEYCDDGAVSISVDDQNNIYTTGSFKGNVDFDPGPDSLIITSIAYAPLYGGTDDMFVSKLDSAGNFIWAKRIGGTLNEKGYGLSIKNNSIYITGMFQGTCDFDPGLGISNRTSFGSNDVFIQRLDSDGNLMWVSSIGGTGADEGRAIVVDDNEDFFFSGQFTGTIDFDAGPDSLIVSTVMNHVFYLKYGQDICSSMTLIIDSTNNINCNAEGYIGSQVLNGWPPLTYDWSGLPGVNSPSVIIDTNGIYQLTVTDAYSCSRTTNVLINGPAYGTFDLNTNLVTTCFRPGHFSNLWPHTINEGCINTSGQLKVVLDTLLNYISASPIPDLILADTLIWNFSNLIFDSTSFTPTIMVYSPIWSNIGDVVNIKTMVTPIVSDADTSNNLKNYQYNVVNSYDPNDKKIYPSGECNANYILNNEVITYTIRFQNTGNADAINIYVLDTLDINLDLNSIRVVGNSHPVITEVLPDNVLKFRFDNIMLPDSNSNELLSHGYIIFEVMPDSGVANNTPIENTSHIFFDFNSPVATNTVNNTIVNTIPYSSSSITLSNCDTITINGYNYPISGTYFQYFNNYLGCDSILTLNLNINDSSSAIITTSACNNFTLNSNTYTSSGTYYQTLTNSVGCDSILVLDLTINNIDNSIVQTSYTLTANHAGATYQWIDCNNSNLPISGETSQSFTATANGNYALIINANGCTDTSACQTIFGFGIDNNDLINRVSISPNPTNSIITISSLVDLKDATIQITNIDGQILLQKNHINGKNYSMDLNELNAGMYFVHIYSEGKKAVLKVVKN